MKRALVSLCLALSVAGCQVGAKQPLNPPRLVWAEPTDMAIQLFVQATILLGTYYRLDLIPYDEFRRRSEAAGFSTLPFMPPETVRATPELNRHLTSPDISVFVDQVVAKYGYKALVKYYIRTGLRASQLICRHHLLSLQERNQYIEFLKKEFGVAYGLATGILTAVGANGTISNAFSLSRTTIEQATDIYQDYRFLNVDREAARVLVETAQAKYAELFMKAVDAAGPESTATIGGYTFADALNAISVIEYQCTREGIRGLINRSINNTPSNLEVDVGTGQVIFSSSQSEKVVPAAEVVPVRGSPTPPPGTQGGGTVTPKPGPDTGRDGKLDAIARQIGNASTAAKAVSARIAAPPAGTSLDQKSLDQATGQILAQVGSIQAQIGTARALGPVALQADYSSVQADVVKHRSAIESLRAVVVGLKPGQVDATALAQLTRQIDTQVQNLVVDANKAVELTRKARSR